jgi:CubicO group peptidase (beta-lactamase class C family)
MTALTGQAAASAPAKKAVPIKGICEPRFNRVREVFEENFKIRGDLGAAVCVYYRGEKVVDFWGGWADPDTQRPWQEDTMVCMMSVGKGVAAMCLYRLIEQGRLDLQAPVAKYWPAFAQAGKDAITVEQLMGGLGGVLFADAAPDGSLLDWETVIDALEKQAPSWAPGSRGGYHSMSAPFLFSELVRKVDGRPIEVYFREEFAEPLGLDYAFGLNDTEMARNAKLFGLADNPTQMDMRDPSTQLGRAWRLRPRDPETQNAPHYLSSRARGYGAPRSVAKLYAAMSSGGVIDEKMVFEPETIAEIRKPRWEGECGMTGRWYAYALGLFINREMAYMGPNPTTFGHPGVGGALGFADPENGIGFGYGGNSLSPLPGVGDRCRALIDATYACLDDLIG